MRQRILAIVSSALAVGLSHGQAKRPFSVVEAGIPEMRVAMEQKRVTSREQAFCSSGVPLRACWAKASDETGIDNRKRPKRTLRIVFLHFGSKKSSSRMAFRHGRDGFCGIADAAYRSNEKRTSTAKCGQIRSERNIANNHLISNGYFHFSFVLD